MAAVNFNGFSVAVYCILMIYQKKVIHASYDTLIYIFNFGMPVFAMAALLRRIKGVLKAFHSCPFHTKWLIDYRSWVPDVA